MRLACRDNHIKGDVPDMRANVHLEKLSLQGNEISAFHDSWFTGFLWPSLQGVYLSRNRFGAALPQFGNAMTPSLSILDLSFNPKLSVDFGAMLAFGQVRPAARFDAWLMFLVIQLVRLEGTDTSIVDNEGGLVHGFETDLHAIRSFDSVSKSSSCFGFFRFDTLTVSPSAHRSRFCTCNAEYFRNSEYSECIKCRPGCRCHGGRNVSGCFPAVQQLLLCPLLSDGTTACEGRVLWNYAANASSIAAFCRDGHHDRLCSRCVPDYFEAGRVCTPCLKPALQWLSIVGFIAVFIGLLVYLYVDTDGDDPQSMRIRILLFHVQQLGVLMTTQAAFPAELLPWLSFLSAGGTFSFSSVVAVDCPPLNFTLADELWFTFTVSLVAVLVAAAIFTINATDASDAGTIGPWFGVLLAFNVLFLLAMVLLVVNETVLPKCRKLGDLGI
jgi:hypothetical protein